MATLKNLTWQDPTEPQKDFSLGCFHFSTFVNSYLEAAAWADKPEECDLDHFNFDEASVKQAREDCEEFFNKTKHLLKDKSDMASMAGHDFWLTRNHHGAGFWDRPEYYGKREAERLTTIAHAFGDKCVTNDETKLYIE